MSAENRRRRTAQRLAKQRGGFVAEVIFHDPIAASLADLFLPPENSHVSNQELIAACKHLAAATSAFKRLGRES